MKQFLKHVLLIAYVGTLGAGLNAGFLAGCLAAEGAGHAVRFLVVGTTATVLAGVIGYLVGCYVGVRHLRERMFELTARADIMKAKMEHIQQQQPTAAEASTEAPAQPAVPPDDWDGDGWLQPPDWRGDPDEEEKA